jgi:hypothetical protein
MIRELTAHLLNQGIIPVQRVVFLETPASKDCIISFTHGLASSNGTDSTFQAYNVDGTSMKLL